MLMRTMQRGRATQWCAMIAAALLVVIDDGCSSSTHSSQPAQTTHSASRARRRRRGDRGEAEPMAGPTAQSQTGAAPPIAIMLQSVDRALRAQNYQPLGGIQQQNFMPRGILAFPIQARPGACYAVFAIGDAGVQDVDMAMLSPRGAVMGSDQREDVHPHVEFCALEPGMHLARVTMIAGSGNVVFGVYQGPPGSYANLASAFEPSGGAAPQVAGAPDGVTAARIEALRTQLQSSGYQMVGQLRGMAMQNAQTESMPAFLPPNACYTFATFGGPGVQSSNLFLFDGNGSHQIAADAAPHADAVLRDVCPRAAQSYQIRPRVAAGTGTVWFLAMVRNASGGTNGAPGPDATNGNAPIAANIGASTGGGVASVFNQLARGLQSVGYAPAGEATSHTLVQAADESLPMQLQAGHCYAIVATGDSTVQNLDVVLEDASGHEVDRDYGASATPIVRVCPTTTANYAAHVHMTAGQGGYRLGLFHWEGGTSGAGMQGILFVRNAEVTRVLQGDGYTGDADFELFRARIQEGRTATHPVTLQASTCYAFVAVGGAGLNSLNMQVQQGRTTVAEDAQPTAFPAVRYCATATGAHQIVIRSAHGSGDFVFRVFRRQDSGNAVGNGGA